MAAVTPREQAIFAAILAIRSGPRAALPRRMGEAAVEHVGARERLALVGAESMSDAELVSVLLGTGVPGEPVQVMAHRVLAQVGGLGGLERLGAGAIADHPGVGAAKAARLVCAIELGRRVCSRPVLPGMRIACSRDVDAWLRPRLGRAPVEEFLAIPLDAKNRAMGELRIARGGLSACPVSPRDVFRALLREQAAGVIFVHNHPSGDPQPSPEDRVLTERLAEAGELLGVRVLDHVIVAQDGYYSFLDAGLLAARR